MGQFQDVQAFVREANKISRLDDLKPLLADALKELGFCYYSFIHHVSESQASAGFVRMVNYPSSWIELVQDRQYFFDDPVLAACQRSATGFVWSKLPEILELTKRQKEIMKAASVGGLGEGFTLPVHIPGEVTGSCSMGVGAGQPFPEAALPAAQYVASFAFESARRLNLLERQFNSSNNKGPRQLTRRQLDCVVLVARGKSDWDISKMLGISDQTVHQHVEEAKRRFGVASRTQLVVRALFDSHLTFSDILN
jgi:LuxR family quorum-sensing system transcriptional regulator CciR